jgi:hypothetical protein
MAAELGEEWKERGLLINPDEHVPLQSMQVEVLLSRRTLFRAFQIYRQVHTDDRSLLLIVFWLRMG